MVLKLVRLLIFVSCGFYLSPVEVWADDVPLRVVLFSGKVGLRDAGRREVPAVVGQEISSEKHPWITVGKGSRLFLQRGNRLIRIESAGVYHYKDLEKRESMTIERALDFLDSLGRPRTFVSRSRARGDDRLKHKNDAEYFEDLWRQLVQEPSQQPSAFSPEDLLAAAAWYRQQGGKARLAYILERLDDSTRHQDGFYQQLRNDALRGISLVEINGEVARTRREISSNLPSIRYKALLIGIDRYDNPTWQTLANPIRDVEALGKVLLEDYYFRPDDILLLKNPTFDRIIGEFHRLKEMVDENTDLLVYYAGHGYYPPDEEEGYWIPADAGDPRTQRLFLPTSIILSKMKAIKSRHTLLVADSCFSGSLIRKTRGIEIHSRFYRELSRKKSRQIITSGGLEPVSDQGGGNHSVFAGKFLAILSTDRPEPLSASELALNLRKEVKNLGMDQTPEYGRLHMSDDENGEFFFVRKDQNTAVLEAVESDRNVAPIVADREQDEIDQEKKTKDTFGFQSRGEERWWNLGLFFHTASLEYNRPYRNSTTGQSHSVKITSTFSGSGMQGEIRGTSQALGYGIRIDLGQLNQTDDCADDEDYASEAGIRFCAADGSNVADTDGTDNERLLSGQFSHIGLFLDYSLFAWRLFSLQLGGEVNLQYYQLDNYIGEEPLDSRTLGTCAKAGFSFRKNRWMARCFLDLCLTTFQIGGSLYETDKELAENVRLTNSFNFGIASGFEF
ncbi:MAG: caspase family protein [Proteobacteria bacterium]|nr:caspase family protein [Pseudomonadota bacterium]